MPIVSEEDLAVCAKVLRDMAPKVLREREVLSARKERDKAYQDLEAESAEVARLQKELSGVKDSRHHMNVRLEEAEEKIKSKDEWIASLEKKVSDLEKKANLELGETHEELLELRRELTKAQNLSGKLQKDVEFWKKDCDERGKEIHRLEGELKETNGEVEDLSLRVKGLMTKLENCKAANADLRKICNERHEKIKEHEVFKKSLEDENEKLKRKLALSQANSKQKDQRIQEMLELRRELLSCVDQFSEHIKQLREWE